MGGCLVVPADRRWFHENGNAHMMMLLRRGLPTTGLPTAPSRFCSRPVVLRTRHRLCASKQQFLTDTGPVEQMAAGTLSPEQSIDANNSSNVDGDVPTTWEEVVTVFCSQPSVLLPAAAILVLGAYRLQQPFSLVDPVVAGGVAAFWLLQEWVVHSKLLHSEIQWFGRDIHEHHHTRPYFHVSVDPPGLIGGVMGLAAVVFYAAFQGGPLAFTAIVTYFTMGLIYEWLHYVVHTQWVPPPSSTWLRAIRRHHMLHHCRNEAFWLSFTLPAVDQLFGTLPARGSSIPLTPLARRSSKGGG